MPRSAPAPDSSVGAEVTWTGGGTPANGTGRTFTTVFSAGGTFRVAARAGEADIDVTVTVCPIDEWLARFRRLWAPRLEALATDVARGKRQRAKRR